MNSKQFALCLVLALITGGLGFFIGKNTNVTLPGSNPQVTVTKIKTSSLFRNQTATIQGVITDVKNNLAVIKSINGLSDSFKLSENLTSYESGKVTKTASSSAQAIEKNREAMIVLELSGDHYEVIAVTYLPKVASR